MATERLNSHKNNCEMFGPLRVSESRKAATVERVIKSVNQAVSSNYIQRERVINKVKTDIKSTALD